MPDPSPVLASALGGRQGNKGGKSLLGAGYKGCLSGGGAKPAPYGCTNGIKEISVLLHFILLL